MKNKKIIFKNILVFLKSCKQSAVLMRCHGSVYFSNGDFLTRSRVIFFFLTLLIVYHGEHVLIFSWHHKAVDVLGLQVSLVTVRVVKRKEEAGRRAAACTCCC